MSPWLPKSIEVIRWKIETRGVLDIGFFKNQYPEHPSKEDLA